MGRPSRFNSQINAKICGELAEGRSLRSICRDPEMPAMATVMRWLFEESKFRDRFREQYRRARQIQAEVMADELIDIADDASEDETVDGQGRVRHNKEFAARSKLRVETRQWVAMRLLPKVYGPNVGKTVDEDETPEPISTTTIIEDASGEPDEA